MTEEEALEKWCPFTQVVPIPARQGQIVGGAPQVGLMVFTNRQPDKPQQVCIGSGCAAWRTEKLSMPDESTFVNGWCGLAGRP